MAVAELMHAVAVEIEDAPPVDVDQSCALGPHDLRQARRRQRLAQEIALILIESVARPLAGGLPPSGARWRDVDVAFAERHGGIFHVTRVRAENGAAAIDGDPCLAAARSSSRVSSGGCRGQAATEGFWFTYRQHRDGTLRAGSNAIKKGAQAPVGDCAAVSPEGACSVAIRGVGYKPTSRSSRQRTPPRRKRNLRSPSPARQDPLTPGALRRE